MSRSLLLVALLAFGCAAPAQVAGPAAAPARADVPMAPSAGAERAPHRGRVGRLSPPFARTSPVRSVLSLAEGRPAALELSSSR